MISCPLILHIWWLENWSTPKKFLHHFIHYSPKVLRKVEVSSVLHVHTPIIFLVSYSYIIIIDILELVKCYNTPFIFASRIIIDVCWTTSIHYKYQYPLPIGHYNLELDLNINDVYIHKMFISFRFNKNKYFIVLPIWLMQLLHLDFQS